jgi:hypothetical protein
VADLDHRQARLADLKLERFPKTVANRGIANHVTVRTNAIDNEWNAGQGSDPKTAGAAITDDGIGSSADYVPGSRAISRASVESCRCGAMEETPVAQRRNGDKKNGSAPRRLHRDVRGYLTR